MNTGSMSAEIRTEVVVIGGGAAGMMAAYQAALSGAHVMLLEKNEKLGKKLYITGKGRCNVTNIADRDEFLRQTPRNPKFLITAITKFDHQDMVDTLQSLGTPTKVERGGRVFPMSGHASDVTRALDRGMKQAGVQVCFHAEALELSAKADGIRVIFNDSRILSSACVVATGGRSYPSTGSTGDGYRFARENGMEVTAIRGSLVGLVSPAASWPGRLQGLALRNVRLVAKHSRKVFYDELGEMLFTHYGISGPLAIELSSHLPDNFSDTQILLDMKPGMTAEEVDRRLQRELVAKPKQQLGSMLKGFMPSRLIPVFVKLCNLDPTMTCACLDRGARAAIGHTLKGIEIPISGLRPVEEAIVTRGGVDVRGIFPGTMMSRLHPGLFFAGEVLDVDAHTGGFNLQAAFSTGALAGRYAAAFALQKI